MGKDETAMWIKEVSLIVKVDRGGILIPIPEPKGPEYSYRGRCSQFPGPGLYIHFHKKFRLYKPKMGDGESGN